MRGRGGEGLFALLLLSASAAAGELEDAGRLFEARCANCHTLPDRELRGDRAWISQVSSTA